MTTLRKLIAVVRSCRPSSVASRMLVAAHLFSGGQST
ncbi:hypothetical protein WJX84_005403 [Apatococcus fuscideae]|uniref:Uncharacterized protein n=1 Tax=Apatococcus fuscideae TaxID=2026836 RepID=A0AAW1T885_9CHLO